MIVEQVDTSKQSKLFMSLQSMTGSFARRGTVFEIHAHSEYVANITIVVTGKKGTVQKDIVLAYNETNSEWVAYSECYKYTLLSLSEISTVIKSKVQGLFTIVSKI